MEHPTLWRAEVHQATGMIMVQPEVPPGEALVRLRAHAYVVGRPIGAVAEDVVTCRLRFDEADHDERTGD